MAQMRYKRVAQTDPDTAEDEAKKSRAERIEKITSKIHAFLWIS